MKNLKKLLCLGLAVIMCVAMAVPAFAAGTTVSAPGEGTTKVELTAEAATFSVTVPTAIAIKVNADGTVTCPSDLKLVNLSTAAVYVSKIEMQDSAWALKSFDDTQMNTLPVDSKKLAVKFTANGDAIKTAADGNQVLLQTAAEGVEAIGDSAKWYMSARVSETEGSELPFAMEAHATAVSAAIAEGDKQTAANVIFTVGWATPAIIAAQTPAGS